MSKKSSKISKKDDIELKIPDQEENEDENDANINDLSVQQHYQDDLDDEEEDESSPFPVPMDSNTLNRTSLLNLTKETGESSPASKDPNQPSSKSDQPQATSTLSNVLKAFKSAPSNTKLFLGIESGVSQSSSFEPNNNNNNNNNNEASNRSNPLPVNKTLNNWNQRTFKVLNNNLVFGGKIKEDALDRYISNLDEGLADESDPFLYYKSTGESQMDYGKRVSVAGLAAKGVRRMFKVFKRYLFYYLICKVKKIK
jgi:hypothetical protein